MKESLSKLFHAIVGLGLAAGGCGRQATAASGDGGTEKASGDGRDAGDAAPDLTDTTVPGADATDGADASDSPDLEIDAMTAHDAAADVAQEPWVQPPVK